MSTALSTSRASSRPSKEKHAKAVTQLAQIKSDGQSAKMQQATPEQMRLAQMIGDHNTVDEESEFRKKVNQIIELTGRSTLDAEIALHDCQNDTEKAINMLLEGENDQGEWRSSGKKKKRSNAPQQQKTEPVSNHVDEKPNNREQSSDRDRPERPERSESNKDRRGRRFDSRPPRLARGRGRERGEFRNNRDSNDHEAKENGFGTFDKDRDIDSSRGRGRGRGRGGPRRGRGRNPRFDKGPQIDTWTNETAENAEKENTTDGWQSMEDWTEDTWTGNLTETKIFTKSSGQNDQQSTENSSPMTDTTNTILQSVIFEDKQHERNRLPVDLGLLSKHSTDQQEPSYITQYNQQATESIKNSIGIGSSPRQGLSSQLGGSSLTNHLQSGSLSSQLPSTTLSNQLTNSQQSAAVNALVSSFTQQTSYSQNQSSFSQSSGVFSQSQPSAYSTSQTVYNQNRSEYSGQGQTGFSQGQSSFNQTQSDRSVYGQSPNSVYGQTSSVYSQSAASAFSSTLDQQSSSPVLSQSQDSVPATQANALPQRPKTQRTKLPPPSKIPASAVEMPGHMMTTLDVQFGNWEIPESFSFMGDATTASNLPSTASSSSTPTITGHLSQASQQSESVIVSSIMTTPPSNSTSADQGQTSPRSSMFHNSPYTTPTKKDPGPRMQTKMSPPEPIPFPPSQNDRKSSPMMSSQRPSSNASLVTGSTTSKPDANNLNSYSQSNQGYQSTPYQSQKSAISGSALSNSSGLTSGSSLTNNQGISNTGLSNSGLSGSGGLSNTSGLSNSSGLSNPPGLSNSAGLSNTGGISNTSGLSNSGGLSNSSGYPHTSAAQPGSYQNQYQSGSNQYQTSQNQYGQSAQNQYGQTGQSQYQNSGSQYHNSQNQYQNYSQTAGSAFPNQSSYSAGGNYSGSSNQQNQGNSSLYQNSATNSYQSHSNQNSLYHQGASSQTTSYQPQSNSSYHRDSQAGSYPTSVSRDSQASSFQANVSQSGAYPTSASRDSQSGASAYPTSVGQQSSATSYQRDSQQSSTSVTQSQTGYNSQGYEGSPHQNSLPSNLQTSPLSSVSANKISETLSKMTVKDSSMDTRQSPSQYDSATSTTTSSLTPTTITTSLSTGSSTPSAVSVSSISTTASSSARISTAPSTTTKATPSLPPGVQLLGHQYIMGQGTLPPFYGLQQPLYASYTDDLQLLQQRLPPLPNYNYADMTAFGVPTTMTSRDQTTLGNVPYSGGEKIGRVDAQSPIPSTPQQQQSTQSAHQQHFINLPYGYYYPPVLPNAAATAAGFQYPATMFPVPPVTNTAHAGTTANTQYQKTYGSHGYGSNKGYEDLTQGTDFTKSTYVNQTQNKVSAVTGSVATVGGAGEIPGTGYGKSHTQGFDKQGFHAGTPPPFNLPLGTGTQAGPLGAPTTPYAAAPFVNVPMMPQPHSQMLHPTLQQDSTSVSSRGSHVHAQQSSTQAKTGGAKYASTNWGAYQ